MSASASRISSTHGNCRIAYLIGFSGGISGGDGWSGGSALVGTPLSVAYRQRAIPDLTNVLPRRPDDNSDITPEKFQERVEYYQAAPTQLSAQRLLPTMIIGSAHNEARGDVAAAKGRGISSLRPGGGLRKGGGKHRQDDAGGEGGEGGTQGGKRASTRDED